MLGRLPHDTAGLVELDLHVLIQVPRVSLRVVVTIATSRGHRRTVSSKWLKHALILVPLVSKGKESRVAGHQVILHEKHQEVCNLSSGSYIREHNEFCPT